MDGESNESALPLVGFVMRCTLKTVNRGKRRLCCLPPATFTSRCQRGLGFMRAHHARRARPVKVLHTLLGGSESPKRLGCLSFHLMGRKCCFRAMPCLLRSGATVRMDEERRERPARKTNVANHVQQRCRTSQSRNQRTNQNIERSSAAACSAHHHTKKVCCLHGEVERGW